MAAGFENAGKVVIFLGILLIVLGAVLLITQKIPQVWHLPGDIVIKRNGFSFYFPLTSCFLASAIISLGFWLFAKLK